MSRPRVAPVRLRGAGSLRSLCMVFAFATTQAGAQGRGETRANGQLDVYQQFLLRVETFATASLAIAKAVDDVDVNKKYCDAESKRRDGVALQVARARFDSLANAWTDFKYETNRLIGRKADYDVFHGHEEDAGESKFWDRRERVIIRGTSTKLRSAENKFALNKPQDCRQKANAPSPPPPPRPSPPVDLPTLGLRRPVIPPLPEMPSAPTFCTQKERDDWIYNTLRPPMVPLVSQISALRQYGDKATDLADGRPFVKDSMGRSFPQLVAPATLAVLRAEVAWARSRATEVGDRYDAMARFRDGLQVTDCSRPRTSERPRTIERPRPGVIETTPPIDSFPHRVGMGRNPHIRIGLGAQYAYFDKFPRVARDQPNLIGFAGGKGTTGVGGSIGVDWNRWSCDKK